MKFHFIYNFVMGIFDWPITPKKTINQSLGLGPLPFYIKKKKPFFSTRDELIPKCLVFVMLNMAHN